MSDIYDLKLGQDSKKMLLWIAQSTESEEIATVSCLDMSSLQARCVYELVAGGLKETFVGKREDPVIALAFLGLLQTTQVGETEVLFLTEKGREWGRYHRRRWVARVSERIWDWLKQQALSIISLCAFVLVILQILQALRSL